jgi:hypothetical protein
MLATNEGCEWCFFPCNPVPIPQLVSFAFSLASICYLRLAQWTHTDLSAPLSRERDKVLELQPPFEPVLNGSLANRLDAPDQKCVLSLFNLFF